MMFVQAGLNGTDWGDPGRCYSEDVFEHHFATFYNLELCQRPSSPKAENPVNFHPLKE